MKHWIAAALLLVSVTTQAADLTVTQAWTRASAPGQDSAAVRAVIVSQRGGNLVGVSSPLAATGEIHTMSHENGMMKMHAIDSLKLAAGQPLDLSQGGEHLMLLHLKQPLRAGETLPLTLTIQFADQHRESVDVAAEIRPLTAGSHAHPH